MLKFFSSKFLDFFDNIHKKKIFNFLKSKNIKKINTFFDIGAHRGETIEYFGRKFDIDNIYSFEPSPINFKYLKKNTEIYKKKLHIKNLVIENFGLGKDKNQQIFNQSLESSSSSFKKVNLDSNYLKKKKFFFNLKNLYFDQTYNVRLKTLDEYIEKNEIKAIDFLKIDTEGYELEVLQGLKKNFKIVNIILLEHHYDNMIDKGYKFKDINDILTKNNFTKIYKLKMPFRKTFEYIYQNRKSN